MFAEQDLCDTALAHMFVGQGKARQGKARAR